MNNKGFTLIELIMVIAILAMLALFAAPNVIKLINKNKADNYNGVIDSIIEATDLYASDNRYDLNFNGSCTPGSTNTISATITLQNLIDSKNISSPVTNPCTKENIPSTTNIKINLNCKTKQFTYEIIGFNTLAITSCNELG